MKKAILTVVFLGAVALVYFSCRKDLPSTAEAPNLLQKLETPGECKTFVRGEGSAGAQDRSLDDEVPTLTVLGGPKPNPFARSVMTQAYNNIYEPDVAQVPFTHLYVRFLPADAQQYRKLGDIEGLEMVDFPLDRVILVHGDYYHDPTIP